MDALILVGGFGTRMRPLTFTIPKNILPIANKSLLERVMDILPSDIDKIILSMGYKTKSIKAEVETKISKKYRKKIVYVQEKKPLGTAGAIKFAQKHIGDEVLVLNGDILADIDIKEFIDFHKNSSNFGSIVLKEVSDPTRYGACVLDRNKIVNFIEKPKDSKHRWINAGIYLLRDKVLDYIKADKFSMIEKDVFPKLARESKLGGFRHKSFWIDTGTPKAYFEANRYFQERESLDKFDIPMNVGDRQIKTKTMNIGPYVSVGYNCQLEAIDISDSILLDNVEVGEGSIIKHSIIGPNCVIGDHVLVKNSILGEDIKISDDLHIENSKICPNKSIKSDVFDNIIL